MSSRTASASRRRASASRIEFLLDEPSFQPHHMPFIKNLATLGIEATLRIVDPVQIQQRASTTSISTSRSSASASRRRRAIRCALISPRRRPTSKGSQNLAGIADPAIDALIDKHHRRRHAGRLTTACRALDRVIRAGRYWIPHWYKASHWIAYWDVFGRPPAKPRYARGVPETWWYDPRQGGQDRAVA